MTKIANKISRVTKPVMIQDETPQEQLLKARAKRQPLEAAPPGQEYVDPFLFESGYFKSREEYDEVMRNAKIKPRARA